MSDSRIYFIKSTRSNVVKIGVANDVHARLLSLQTANAARLVLIAEMPGDERYERMLHQAFAEYRIRGEWFRLDGELRSFISLLPEMFDESQRQSRQRQTKEVEATYDEATAEYYARYLLPMIRDAVDAIGVVRFAEIVGARRGDVVRALYQRGRYFSIDWFVELLALTDEDTRYRLVNLFLEPLGLQADRRQLADTLGGRP